MGYIYTWNGTSFGGWGALANWTTTAGFSPRTGSLSDTQDATATVIFNGGPAVTGFGSANFFQIYKDQTFLGAFSADGQPAIGLQTFFTAFQVTAGAATFTGASAKLTTQADVLVGYGDPAGGAPASLVFSGGATAILNTNNAINYLGARISEDSLYIGYDHNGSVDIEGGATRVTTDSGVVLGVNASVSGSLHVGTGAHLEIGSYDLGFGFSVGNSGSGAVLIDGAATVKTDGGVNIGQQTGGHGAIIVDGAGSDLHSVQAIYVGTPSSDPTMAGGTGTLTVSNGATVETDSSIKVYANSVLTITGGSSVTSTGLSGAGARIEVLNGGVVNLAGSLNAIGTNPDAALVGVQVESGGLISGWGQLNGAYLNDGTIDAKSLGSSQTLLVNATFGPLADPETPGILSISGDATLELIGGVAASETIVFNNDAEAGFHETLKIDGPPSAFQAPISGLKAGDVIDLAGVSGATTWSLNSTTDILSVEDATGATLAALQLIGNFAGVSFAAAADGSGGFKLTESAAPTAPQFTSGSGRVANYVVNNGFRSVAEVQASGTDVQYFLKDPRTGKLVSSTSQFTIDAQSGALSFNKAPGYGDYSVTVVAKNAAGQTSQNLNVDVEGPLLIGDCGASDTFVFHPGFKTDILFGFQTQSGGGWRPSPHDVLQFDHALFAGAVQGETGSALVALLQNSAQQVFGGTLINTSTNDHLLLLGVSKQSLLANASADVHIV